MQTKEMTKLYKLLIFVGALFSVGGAISGIFYMPKEMDRLKQDMSQLKTQASVDHDNLIEVRSDVKNIKNNLQNNKLAKQNMYDQQETNQSSVYGVTWRYPRHK